jgi:2-polyprenyl-3-methyl-5-hydroxy-6-metoxy-1,4-benzoquinol methylase
MTVQSMQWHEAVTLRHTATDYRRRGLLALVRPYLTGPRVLDMRCLTGQLAVDLAARGFEVTGLDAFRPAAAVTNAQARRRGVEAEIARAWDLADLRSAVNGSRFDCVVCLDVLNHVADDEAMVAQIAQVLSPGGRLILAVPAFPGLLGKRDRTLGHLRRYTRAGLTALLARHGLAVRHLRYWNFIALPPYVLIERLLGGCIPDGLRYRPPERAHSWPSRLLGWWYEAVESRVRFPCGLSLFVVAHKHP